MKTARTHRGTLVGCNGKRHSSLGPSAATALSALCLAAAVAGSLSLGCGGSSRQFSEDLGGAGSVGEAGSGSDEMGGRAGGQDETGGTSAGGAGTGGPSDGGNGGSATGGATLGDAGEPATPPSCEVAADCPELETQPSGCAFADCDSEVCVYAAVDGDGDGFASSECTATDSGVEIDLGEDCDDGDDAVHPGAWDGPGDTEHPEACNDSVDNDCNGTLDDGELEDGSRCVCEAGDTLPCTQTSTGVDITYPSLDGAGLPLGNCRVGNQTCDEDGAWSVCVGAVGPSSEVCDRADNDCDGVADDEASDMRTFWYDADGDFHTAPWSSSVVACYAPTAAPAECADAQGLCPAAAWTTTPPVSAEDCDDTDANRHPGASEECNRIDDDCSNTNGSSVEPLEDQDEDGFTSEDYSGCSGGNPKTDCFDLDANVRPDQLERFEVGYCLTENTPFWCSTERQCAAIDTCADSIGQVWGEGSVDYNCDGVEEPFTVAGTDTAPYSSACAAAPLDACEGPATPPYAVSANASCGAIDQHMQCRLNTAGTVCSYQSTFLMTACR